MCSSPSPPPRPQRRASTPGREGGGASGRTRSPRRGGGAKSLSRSASPAGSPRRGRACVPSSADDEAEVLSSRLTVGANGQLSSGACTCDVASQHRDLVKRYSEKCAQLREAHALRCSLELRIFQLQALGPRGASRQRLLAAEAAAEAAEAAVRAERERRRVREGQLLALLERGEVEAAKARLAAGSEAEDWCASPGGGGALSPPAAGGGGAAGGGRRGEAPVEEAVIAAARAAAEAEAAALEAAMDSEEEEGGSTNDETDAVAAEAEAEVGEEEASADDQGSDVHSELHGEATRKATCPPPAAKSAAAAASPLMTCDDEDATDGTCDEKHAEATSDLESEDEEEQSVESEEDALLAGEDADDIEDDAVEAESEESEIESSASGEVSKAVPARLSSALQSFSVRGSDESLEIQTSVPSSNQLFESSQRSDELDSNDDFLSRLARAESNPATPR